MTQPVPFNPAGESVGGLQVGGGGGGGVPLIPSSIIWVDPAGINGGSDLNNGTQQVSDGAGNGPKGSASGSNGWLSRWGLAGFIGEIQAGTTQVIYESSGSTSDPVALDLLIRPAGILQVTGQLILGLPDPTLPPPQLGNASGTVAAAVQRNRAAAHVESMTYAVGHGLMTKYTNGVGLYVSTPAGGGNPTVGWVARAASDTNPFFSPLYQDGPSNHIGLTTAYPTEQPEANGDTYQMFIQPQMALARMRFRGLAQALPPVGGALPVPAAPLGTYQVLFENMHFVAPGTQVSNLSFLPLETDSMGVITFSQCRFDLPPDCSKVAGVVRFINCCFPNGGPVGVTTNQNGFQAGVTVLGGLIGGESGIIGGWIAGGLVLDGDAYISAPYLSAGGEGTGQTRLGLVCFSAGNTLAVSGPVIFVAGLNVAGPIIWNDGGAPSLTLFFFGTLGAQGNSRYHPAAGTPTAAATFVGVAPPILLDENGATVNVASAYATATGVWTGNISFTLANLDAAIGAGGFGGTALGPNSGVILAKA